MKKIHLILANILFFLSTIAAQSSLDQLEKYKELNDTETRLLDYKDSEETLKLKLLQLDYINSSRTKYNSPPVELDILASRVANKMCVDASEGNFRGHYNTLGEKPYHRYAFAGGLDHISENTYCSWESSGYKYGTDIIQSMMKSAHDEFMEERIPNDGHKKNCLDPHHNYVGIGVNLGDEYFRYYEEYLNRYLLIDDFESTISQDETIIISVKPVDEKHTVYFVMVFYEDFPQPMTVNQVNRIRSYRDYTKDKVFQLAPWDIPSPDEAGKTNFTFNFSRSGLYYIKIYLSDTPHEGNHASTVGKIQASGIVIQVR